MLTNIIQKLFPFANVVNTELIQKLWSDYGTLERIHLSYSTPTSDAQPQSVIVKRIAPPDLDQGDKPRHPRGWSGVESHQRKLKSYDVEANWYQNWSAQLSELGLVPHCYLAEKVWIERQNQHTEQWVFVLSDLNALGFSKRHNTLSPEQAKCCLTWLAKLHSRFLTTQQDPQWASGLWPIGGYWHLDTRKKEWAAMSSSPLKSQASEISEVLNQCKFKTLIHGDAKVANFCFDEDAKSVTAVDFQYVGVGCGMKDVAYFIGSGISVEDCFEHYESLLDFYFGELSHYASDCSLNISEIEDEWRPLFYLAYADFNRFILGWAPEHHKNNAFSQLMTDITLNLLQKKRCK
ncbi:phosphotransferase [Shewanella gelidii]|uniref:phosphotransferase n=1 Tax=Shewanella gelidii TaxID=1642821 RepID=UPI00166C4EE4|nr:phosphotransferase [Shewanella gelidii]MCL1098115.1 ecdysteroid 22-kinase family protein [Shewanella gelidii]